MNQIIILATDTDKWTPIRALWPIILLLLLILILGFANMVMDMNALARYQKLKQNLQKQIKEHPELRERNKRILNLMDDKYYVYPFDIDELKSILEKYKDVKPEDDIFK